MLYIIKNLLFYESRFLNRAPALFYVLRFRLLAFTLVYCYTQGDNDYFFIILFVIIDEACSTGIRGFRRDNYITRRSVNTVS